MYQEFKNHAAKQRKEIIIFKTKEYLSKLQVYKEKNRTPPTRENKQNCGAIQVGTLFT